MAFNSILRELGNGVDGSYFVDGVAIYITIRNLRVATRALQGVTNKLDSWENTSKTVNIILEREWETNKNHTKKRNHTLQRKYPVPRDDLRQQIELGEIY